MVAQASGSSKPRLNARDELAHDKLEIFLLASVKYPRS
jgi:hypothetical protein